MIQLELERGAYLAINMNSLLQFVVFILTHIVASSTKCSIFPAVNQHGEAELIGINADAGME